MSVEATLYDGSSSLGIPARISVQDPTTIEVRTDADVWRYQAAQVRVSSRLGNSTRYLTLPGGAKLQTNDNDGVDRLVRQTTAGHSHGVLHALEANWGWVAMAVMFTGVFLWWSVFIGLPALANRTAHAIPVALEDTMGQQSLSTLDTHVLKPTRLPESQRERVRRLFAKASDWSRAHGQLDTHPRLELRRADDLGPNAFALPSGIIVVTDELVQLAKQDGELVAVIAHELGHVRHRHIMRSILQNSAVALVLATVLGDVSSITGLAASIPTLLVEQGYSREFEFEADRYAVSALDSMEIEREQLASILKKLGDAHGTEDDVFGDYLSTHPGMTRRIEAIGHDMTDG